MRLGRNIYGGITSWTTPSIRQFATEGGGTPPCEVAVVADNGDIVLWDHTGEVRTVICLADIKEVA